jgi:hypothetical protein
MANSVKISAIIDSTDYSACLGMEIWLDDQQIFDQDYIASKQAFVYELDDDDAEHELRFVMKNKTVEHTTVDESGAIIKDACLTISDLAFDEIDLEHMLTEKSVYTHNFNGAGPTTQDKFYGEAGCNGVVSLKFNTPVYLWLLENL